jgi:hypothetical protein
MTLSGIKKISMVENILKSGWTTNFKMDVAVYSGQGGRMIRKVRNKPPHGFMVKERWVEGNDEIARHKQFRLVSTGELTK